MKIRCPFYGEIKVRYCKAFEKRIMVPDDKGEERYCTCEDYVDCPVYKEFKNKMGVKDDVDLDGAEVVDE